MPGLVPWADYEVTVISDTSVTARGPLTPSGTVPSSAGDFEAPPDVF